MKTPSKSDQLVALMMNVDRAGAAQLIEAALHDGVSKDQVIAEILEPALGQLGVLWGTQEIALAQAFIGAKIAEDALFRCLPSEGQVSSNEPKGTVVIGNIEDDFHSLGRRMVVSFLKASGWEVHDLGNDVTAEVFVDQALEVGALVIGVSAMMHTTALNIKKVRDLIDARGLQKRLKLAVGGAVFIWRPELVDEVGGDGSAKNAALVDALFLHLQDQVRAEVST